MKTIILLDVRLCIPVEVHRRFGGKYGLREPHKKAERWKEKRYFVACILPWFFCFAFCSILKMEAVLSSETSLKCYGTTQPQNTVFFKQTKGSKV
jgi:hypothetical protein